MFVSPRKNYRQTYGKSKASLRRSLSNGTPQKCFSTILCFVPLVHNSYFFFRTAVLRELFDIRFSYNAETLISHTFAYSSRWRRKPWQGLLVDEICWQAIHSWWNFFLFTWTAKMKNRVEFCVRFIFSFQNPFGKSQRGNQRNNCYLTLILRNRLLPI